MKKLLIIVFCLNVFTVCAQNQHDEKINALVEKYTAELNIKCEILIETDVEGMIVPDKKITVDFKENGKPEVKGKGITLLPKKGMINQFKELFSSPFQAIYLSKRQNNLVYKLVSLNQNSDWVTTDIEFDEDTLLIYNTIINTKKFGAFSTENTYDDGMYPSKSIVTFNIKKFKLPLKFIGRTESTTISNSKGKNVLGTVTLSYTYLD